MLKTINLLHQQQNLIKKLLLNGLNKVIYMN
jgi:hypothetical protein